MAKVDSIDSIGSVPARVWAPDGHIDPETARVTVEACAWLIGIAEMSVAKFGWDHGIVRWLDSIGAVAHEAQQKGLQ